MHLVAGYNYTPEVDRVLREAFPMRPSPRMMSGRAILSRDVVQVEDALDDPDYRQTSGRLAASAACSLHPCCAMDAPIGAIVVNRRSLAPFADTDRTAPELCRSGGDRDREHAAAQRAARNRWSEQTATARRAQGHLKFARRDLQPVFQAMLENAVRICEAKFGQMFLAGGRPSPAGCEPWRPIRAGRSCNREPWRLPARLMAVRLPH